MYLVVTIYKDEFVNTGSGKRTTRKVYISDSHASTPDCTVKCGGITGSKLEVLSPTRYTKQGVAVRVDGIDACDHEDAEIGSKRQVGTIQVIIGYEINHFLMVESTGTISGFPLSGGSDKMLVASTFIIPLGNFSSRSGDRGRITGV